jgi:hypothetical protein
MFRLDITIGMCEFIVNNHRQILEIVNEPAQPHQPISIAIRSCVDDDIRSIIGG